MQQRKVQVHSRYLLLPIADNEGLTGSVNRKQTLSIYANDCLVQEIELCLSASPRCWSPIYLADYQNMELTVCLEGGDETLIDLIECSDEMKDTEAFFCREAKPIVHITPMRGYMNDPNGLFYFNGRYHFFAQLNPFGFSPGNTCWMHAVSTDLMHWQELAYALLPDESGLMYSGSGVVDHHNASGLGVDGNPPIFLFYTAAGSKNRWSQSRAFEVGAAVSLDGGILFRKLSQNPLVGHIAFMNRDPKVVYCPEENVWVMALYLDNSRYQLLLSEDLLDWQKTQTIEIPGSAECPDLFCLPLDGDKSRMKWVLWGSPDNYLIGQLKQGSFTQEGPVVKGPSRQIISAHSDLMCGTGSYAAQTYFGLPEGRVVQQAWVQTITQKAPFVSCAGIPNELKLISTPGGPRLSILPVKEVDSVTDSRYTIRNRGLEDLNRIPREAFAECMDITITLRYTQDHPLALSVRGILIVYDPRRDMLLLPNGMFHLNTKQGELSLRILTDRCSLELYTLDGLFNTTVATVLDPAKTEFRVITTDIPVGADIEIRKIIP